MKYAIFIGNGNYSKLSDDKLTRLFQKIKVISLKILYILTGESKDLIITADYIKKLIKIHTDQVLKEDKNLKKYLNRNLLNLLCLVVSSKDMDVLPIKGKASNILANLIEIFRSIKSKENTILCITTDNIILSVLDLANSKLKSIRLIDKPLVGDVAVIYFNNSNEIIATTTF